MSNRTMHWSLHSVYAVCVICSLRRCIYRIPYLCFDCLSICLYTLGSKFHTDSTLRLYNTTNERTQTEKREKKEHINTHEEGGKGRDGASNRRSIVPTILSLVMFDRDWYLQIEFIPC